MAGEENVGRLWGTRKMSLWNTTLILGLERSSQLGIWPLVTM